MAHIAVDMDDVLVDFVGGLIKAMKTEHNADITPDMITQWDLHPLLDPIIGYSWWTWLRKREWIWATFPPIDGALGTIERLRNDGHYIELVTNKPQWAEHNVWKWLGKWRPALNQATIVAGDKADGTIPIRKVDMTTASIIIDDKPSNCQEFIDQERFAILFQRPHNLNSKLTGPSNTHRLALNWQDVYRIIGEEPWLDRPNT